MTGGCQGIAAAAVVGIVVMLVVITVVLGLATKTMSAILLCDAIRRSIFYNRF